MTHVQVTPVWEVCSDHVAVERTVSMLVAASADRELFDATYLPTDMDTDTARRWLHSRPSLSWVIELDGEASGGTRSAR